MINCPNCNGKLISNGTDSRQEWSEELYYCEECGEEFVVRTEYDQSGLVNNQEIIPL